MWVLGVARSLPPCVSGELVAWHKHPIMDRGTADLEEECPRGLPHLSTVAGNRAILKRASWIAAGWALLYALYRAYYAVGGTIGMFGTPVSEYDWRIVNAKGAGILAFVAILPVALLRLWNRSRARPWLLALSWIMAVGGVMHALVGMTQRIASLSGLYVMPLPFWRTIDRRTSDVQALLFNEPWFLIEGLLWVAIAWGGALSDSPIRWRWIGSAMAAAVLLTTVGLLSAFGVIDQMIIG